LADKFMIKVSKRNQITIPAELRQVLNIHGGNRLLVDIQDGMILLIPRPESFTDMMVGLHQEIWRGIDGQQYVNENRED
jgi:AbrB family looped-hinge helix DNA binding protein